VDGHAGEQETSAIMIIRPDLVRTEAIPANDEGMPQERIKPLRDLGVGVGVWWYADHPTHYCGDGRPATAEKGDAWLAARARVLAKIIRVIKDDKETKRLQDEFFARMKQH
jgi:creatinine amidohydrolase